jgi:hypothetical protein
MTFFFKFSHFFLKSIKNSVSWDLKSRKIFEKVFFRKKALKTSELQNSKSALKNSKKIFFAKILHISKMTILSDFRLLSKTGKMWSNIKINVIFLFSVQELTILAH